MEDKVYMKKGENGVAVIYLNQPKKKNAISGEMMDTLSTLIWEADGDGEIKVIVLRGEGENFSTGGDLSQGGPDGMTVDGSRRLLKKYIAAVKAIRQADKPVIAMVDGYAVGGAMSLALACDLAYASETAQFIPNFCNIGIIPEMGIMQILPQIVGPQKAKEILFTGPRISGQEAERLGIVNKAVPGGELEAVTLAMAEELAKRSSVSLSITKGIMNAALDGTLDSVMESESTGSPFCTQTQEYKDMVARFAKK